MSTKAVAWVLDDLQGLKPGPSLVMIALADFADERNSCFPGQDKIAKRARCSKRSVVAYLKELQSLGLISVERRVYSNGHSGVRRTSNRYILHVGKTYSLEDAKSAPSKESAGHNESARFAPSNFESANLPLSKVHPVALNEPPVIEPPVPSPQPPVESGETEWAAAPLGGAPDGAPGEGENSLDLGDVVAGLSPAQRSALLAALGVGEVAVASTQPEPQAMPVAPVQAPAVEDASRSQDELVGLAREVLPEPMQAMAPTALAQVGEMIAERLDAGWTRPQLAAVLRSRELPKHVRSLVALVKARLRDDTPVDAAPPAGTTFAPESETHEVAEWSHELANGRVVTRKDLDCGALAADFHHARAEGSWHGDNRWEFAAAVGIERYLLA